MSAQNILHVTNVSKSFTGDGKALDNVSFHLKAGEMVALIGHSGSGKSTLLRCLSGLISIDGQDGHIMVLGCTVQKNGRISKSIRTIRQNVGFVFQQHNLVERLPLIINVLAGLLGKISNTRTTLGIFMPKEFARAKECLAHVNLLNYAWKRTGNLSGGQQQRGAIARALIQDAKIILADEPIASLDPVAAEEVMVLLRNINKTQNITILVSLHQIDFALRFCDRAIVLHQGKITYDGPKTGLTALQTDGFYKNKTNNPNFLPRKMV